jgi:hypothetical protein
MSSGDRAAHPDSTGESDHPPKPRLVLSVGIVGHRPKDLAKSSGDPAEPPRDKRLTKIADGVKEALAAIKAAALQARSANNNKVCFEEGYDAELILVSALAEGSDSLAADAALKLGYKLDAPLPFAKEDYLKDFKHTPPEEKKNDPAAIAIAEQETIAATGEFERLYGLARSVLQLPGQRRGAADNEEQGSRKENRAYEAAGLTVLSHSDILLAVWDGQLSRGRGGTAEMIAEAARAGLPIVLVDGNGKAPIEIRWRNLMPVPAPVVSIEDLPGYGLAECIQPVINELLRLPSVDEQQTAFTRWFAEKRHHINPRIGYPLLTALLWVRGIRGPDIFPNTPQALAQEYERDGSPIIRRDNAKTIKSLADAYGWADAVAFHYAQVFRSAFVMNFLFAALAVVAASASVLVHETETHATIREFAWWKPRLLVVAEIVLILSVVANTIVGWWRRWHGRWVEAREVAERLRTALPLWALGLRPAFFPGEEPTWTGWYARAVVRMQGLRAGDLNAGGLKPEQTLLINLLTGQCSYNRNNAQRMKRMNHRLEGVGLFLLAATVIVAIDHFLGSPLMHCTIGRILPAHEATIWLSAALPALATATYGIRVIGDFESIHRRAERTHHGLDQLITAIKNDPADFGLLRARARSGADIMLGDVSSWRLSAESRGLAIPG